MVGDPHCDFTFVSGGSILHSFGSAAYSEFNIKAYISYFMFWGIDIGNDVHIGRRIVGIYSVRGGARKRLFKEEIEFKVAEMAVRYDTSTISGATWGKPLRSMRQ